MAEHPAVNRTIKVRFLLGASDFKENARLRRIVGNTVDCKSNDMGSIPVATFIRNNAGLV